MKVREAIMRLKNPAEKYIRNITKTLGLLKTKVWNVIKKEESTGELCNHKQPGRPLKTQKWMTWKGSCGQMRQRPTCTRVIARGKCGEKKELPKIHTTSSVKYGGEGVMAWACMAATGTGSLVFIDDITADGSSKMNSEVYRNILSAKAVVPKLWVGTHLWVRGRGPGGSRDDIEKCFQCKLK